jgi:hypothetical protein
MTNVARDVPLKLSRGSRCLPKLSVCCHEKEGSSEGGTHHITIFRSFVDVGHAKCSFASAVSPPQFFSFLIGNREVKKSTRLDKFLAGGRTVVTKNSCWCRCDVAHQCGLCYSLYQQRCAESAQNQLFHMLCDSY